MFKISGRNIFSIMDVGFVRCATAEDVDAVYGLSCMVELTKDVEQMNKSGFLITQYSTKPELKKDLLTAARQGRLLVYVAGDEILGYICGITQREYLSIFEQEGAKLDNLPKLKAFGVSDIRDLSNVASSDKIAVKPGFGGMGVGATLFAEYIRLEKAKGTEYILAHVVDELYVGGKAIGLLNTPSTRFHEKLGFVKVAESHHSNSSTVYGSGLQTKNSIFLLKISDNQCVVN